MRERLSEWKASRTQWQADLGLIAATLFAFYVIYVVLGLVAGLDTNGIVSTLRRLTFFAAVYALVVLALNLHWGYTGLFNIGVTGFMAVGVYTMAILTGPPGTGFNLPLWAGVLGGMAASALVGLVVALPALRLRADYFAIVTLGFSEIIRLMLLSESLREFDVGGWDVLGFSVSEYQTGTGGGSGIRVTGLDWLVDQLLYMGGDRRNDPSAIGDEVFWFGEQLGVRDTVMYAWVYVLILILFVLLFYLLLSRIASSPFGRVLKAIREDETATRALGKDTNRFKIIVFMVGCALMGLAGILWYGSRVLVTPSSFLPIVTFYVFVALIIGGSGSNTGSVVGAIIFAGALWEGPEMLSRAINNRIDPPSVPTLYDALGALAEFDPIPLVGYIEGSMDQLQFVILGVVLIALMIYRPKGVLGHRQEISAATDLSRPGATPTKVHEDVESTDRPEAAEAPETDGSVSENPTDNE